jgi:hypothetical protein
MGSSWQAEIRDARTETGRQSVMHSPGAQFTPDEEAEAAAIVAWPGGNVGCLATADLFEDIAQDRSQWGRWRSRHPLPERRLGAVVQACDDAMRPPR